MKSEITFDAQARRLKMTIKRDNTYIWVTWLTHLLVGDKSCEWSSWFKANYTNFSKVPSSFNETEWKLLHTELLNQLIDQIKSTNKTIYIESQNAFKLHGNSATLAGKPDIITIAGNRGTIMDVKTGAPSPAHHIQVMIYMYAIPKAISRYKEIVFDGKVVYQTHEDYIPTTSIDSGFVKNLSNLIQRTASSIPAKIVPSLTECSFCNISIADCSQRIEHPIEIAGSTKDF